MKITIEREGGCYIETELLGLTWEVYYKWHLEKLSDLFILVKTDLIKALNLLKLLQDIVYLSLSCLSNCSLIIVCRVTGQTISFQLIAFLLKVGHQRVDSPRVAGHQREILDIQWNPFNDHIIASASEDTTVKIWRIPSGGLTEDLLEPLVDLHGHQRKVGIIRWHPTANGIIASAGFDFKVIVWNALKAKALCTVDGHRDTIFDLAFNYNGSMMATTSKDKKIRVINSHTGKVIQVMLL